MPTIIAEVSVDQALAEAQRIAAAYHGAPAASARLADFQGMYSKTCVVTMEDGAKWVVQLRDNEVDTTKVALAHAKLGPVVPLVQAAATEQAFWAFISPFVEGGVWIKREHHIGVAPSAAIAAEVGSLLAKLSLNEPSDAIVDAYIKPRLQHIIARSLEDSSSPLKSMLEQHIIARLLEDSSSPLKSMLEQLAKQVDTIKILPLALIHEDVNTMNVILNDHHKVVGLIDWEAASLLPLGSNLWCIRFLSFPNSAREDYEAERSMPMAHAFWDSYIASLPSHLLGSDVQRRKFLEPIVVAGQIGLVFHAFFAANEKPNPTKIEQTILRLKWIDATFRPPLK